MATTTTAYGAFLNALGQGQINFTSDDIWVALFTSDYTPDFDFNSDYFNLRNTYEIAEGGDGTTLNSKAVYNRNGQQLSSVSWDYYGNKKAAILFADFPAWTDLTGTFRYAIIYKWVAQSIDTLLIGCIDYGQDTTVTNGAFTVDFTAGVVAVAR